MRISCSSRAPGPRLPLIALETASGAPTVCLARAAGPSLNWQGDPRSGPRSILDGIASLLRSAGLSPSEIDAVACGRGPGAFTGVRLALALAQGLGIGLGRPLLPVSCLAALAWRAWHEHGWPRVLACVDARQHELYWAPFFCSREDIAPASPEVVGMAVSVIAPPGRWALAGSGSDALVGVGFDAAVGVDRSVGADAEAIAALAAPMLARGEVLKPEDAVPTYLRNRVVRAVTDQS